MITKLKGLPRATEPKRQKQDAPPEMQERECRKKFRKRRIKE